MNTYFGDTIVLTMFVASFLSNEVALGVRELESTDQNNCNKLVKISKGKRLNFHIHNFTESKSEPQYCTLLVTTERHMMLVLDLVYSPAILTGTESKRDCRTDYLHVGSDMARVDVDLMTSYKFCAEEARHELVFKSTSVWVVLKSSGTPREFVLKARVHQPVTCASDEFACSPVKCVHRSVICDGVNDCKNEQDEYCHTHEMKSKDGKESEPCFRCGDGTCILPRPLRSDVNYGRPLWFLCDGFQHCPNAWDEREDICWHLSGGRVGAVIECVPSDLQFGINATVFMWNTVRCDGNNDCFHGNDERNCKDNWDHNLRADPEVIGAVAGVIITACVVICVTYRLKMAMKKANRPSTSSTVDTRCTQCTSGDNERADYTSANREYKEALSTSGLVMDAQVGGINFCDDKGDDENNGNSNDDNDNDNDDGDESDIRMTQSELKYTII